MSTRDPIGGAGRGRRGTRIRDDGTGAGDPEGEAHESGGGPQSRLEFWQSLRSANGKRPGPRRLLLASQRARRAQRDETLVLRDALIDRIKAERDDQPPAPPGPAGAVNWTPVGPSAVAFGQATNDPPVSGRITALAVGPGGTCAYAGAANGGVWITEDAGATWDPLDDYFTATNIPPNVQADSLAIGALAVVFGATRADDVVYAGTGESNQSIDSYSGIGIRRFGRPPGGGAPLWTLEATHLAGTWVSRLVVDPDDSTVVYAATGVGLFRRPTSGFATWTALTPSPAPGSSQVTDLAFASTGTDRRLYVAYINGAAYTHDPSANAWVSLSGLPGTPQWVCVSATRVPGAAASQRVAYALTGTGSLFRLAPGATSFAAVAAVPPVTNGQGWYDLAVQIEPGTADTVWLVGDWVQDASLQYNLSLWRGAVSTSGAMPSFGFTTPTAPASDATYRGLGVHADGHAIAFPSDGTATPIFVGCDGGVWRSTTGGAGSFQPRNAGLAITELTFLANWPSTDAASFAGCQDNGTVRFRGEPAWFESPRGDGGGVTIDPNNPYRVMRQYVRVGSYRTAAPFTWLPGISIATDGGQSGSSWSGATIPPAGGAGATSAQRSAVNTENSRTQFYGPLASAFASDLGSTLAAFGTNRVWLSTDWGTTWSTLPTGTNPYASGGTNLTQDVLDDPSPTTFNSAGGLRPNAVNALVFANPNRLYAATGAGIWRFDRTGSTWTRTALPTTGLPAGRVITDIEPVDAAVGSLYVTLAGTPSTHVYFFAGTAGAPWVNCTLSAGGTNLDTPCHAVVVDPANPATLYVATDVGVFRGQRNAAAGTWTWTPFSQGLPQAGVVDLLIHQPTRLLRAATHGRGLWEIELDAKALADPELYMRVNTADTGRLADAGHRYSWVENHPDPSRSGSNVFHWMSPDIKIRRPSLAAPTIGSPPTFLDFTSNVGDYVDTTNIETVDPGANTAYVQVHNRSLTPVNGNDIRVLLLLTDAATGLPALPTGFAANIVAGAAPSTWLSGGWFVGDATSPYQSPAGHVDARLAGVAKFSINVASLGLPATHDHVCAAAFVTTISTADRLAATDTSLDAVTMADRHIVHRNLHVVAAGAQPSTSGTAAPPQTFSFDVHNPTRRAATYDVLLRANTEPFELSLLTTRDGRDGVKIVKTTLDATSRDALDHASKDHWNEWRRALEERLARFGDQARRWHELEDDARRWPLYKLAKLADLDPDHFLITNGRASSSLRVSIPAHTFLTIVATWTPPPDARPGWRGELEIVQRAGKRIAGGSTYSLRVIEPVSR
jgi:hypothetical protein